MSFILDTPMNPVNIFLRSSLSTGLSTTEKNSLSFELNNPIFSYPNMDLIISLKSFSFTNSFYTINENNCMFYYTYDNLTINKFSLDKQNYSIDELISYLNLYFHDIFNFSYSSQKLKITIISITTPKTPFRLVSTDTNNNCYELLGFDDYIEHTDFATQYEAPYMFNMMGVQQLNICLTNINLDSITLKNTQKYNLIDSIQVTSGPGDTQFYYNNIFKYKCSDSNISFISVAIYDQDFNYINFNNIDWFMSLTFEHIYKKSLISSDYLSNQSEAIDLLNILQKKQLLNEL